MKQIFICFVFLIGLAVYIWFEVNVPIARRIDISIDNFSEEIKIVQISDGHGRGITEDGRLMRIINNFNPDAIVLTGDMIDENTVDFKPVLDMVEDLSLKYPVLFILGNHEHANSQKNKFVGKLRNYGAITLINDAKMINGAAICGVDDINFNLQDISKAISVYDRCDILLSHSPAINRHIKGLNIPLVLSGHTHGGQIRLPILGALFIPDENIPNHLVKGLSKENGTWFYVSVGLGTRIVPIRFMNRAEIALITIKPE